MLCSAPRMQLIKGNMRSMDARLSAAKWFQFLCGAFVLTVAVSPLVQGCPPEVSNEIQRCVTPVANYADETLGISVKENLGTDRLQIATNIGADVLQELCEKVATFQSCVGQLQPQCPSHVPMSIINASYGYICSDGYDVFVKNAECLTKLDQDATVRDCHEKTMHAIKNSSFDARVSFEQKLSRMCGSLNRFAKCIERPVLTSCGRPAWNVIVRVLYDTIKTLVPTCKFTVSMPGNHVKAVNDAAAKVNSSTRISSNNRNRTMGRSKVGTMTASASANGRQSVKPQKSQDAARSSHWSGDSTNEARNVRGSRMTVISTTASALFFSWLLRRSGLFST